MTPRLIVQESGGALEFRFATGEIDDRRFPGEQAFSPPLTTEELEDLRWYVEDYLRAPYAVWEDRGQAVADRLDAYGHKLFDSLFGPGKPGRDAFVHAEGQGDYELWLCSSDPGFLGLPWELMADPDPGRPEPLAFRLAGINRTIGSAQKAIDVPSGETLRVLMLIARPYGERDAAYRAVARPLFQKLEAVAGKVEVDLVRPPTLDAMRDALRAAKERREPYHVLHFDGHGAFGAAPPDPSAEIDPTPSSGTAPRASSRSSGRRAGPSWSRPRTSPPTSPRATSRFSSSTPAAQAGSRAAPARRTRSPPAWRRPGPRPWWRWVTASTSAPPPSSWRRSTRACSRARR